MTAVISSFAMFLRQIYRDAMLAAVAAAPLLMGLALRFALPAGLSALGASWFFAEYGLLVDVFMCIMTSYMVCFVSALAIMSEMDDHVAAQLMVSPLGRSGYLFSRLALPAFVAFLYSTAIMLLFSVSGLSFFDCALYSLLSASLSVIASLLMIAIAKNRVEGMAIGKLAGVVVIGAAIPFFIRQNTRFLFAFMPSLWLGEFAVGRHPLSLLAYLLTYAAWLAVLMRAFCKKAR